MMRFQGTPARVFYDFCLDEHVPVDTGLEIGLGTLAVRSYIKSLCGPKINRAASAAASVSTLGPAGRYEAAPFVEKEGFTPILQAACISERFDIAPFSTKGMSVTAARC